MRDKAGCVQCLCRLAGINQKTGMGFVNVFVRLLNTERYILRCRKDKSSLTSSKTPKTEEEKMDELYTCKRER